jgi:hypothetical protein
VHHVHVRKSCYRYIQKSYRQKKHFVRPRPVQAVLTKVLTNCFYTALCSVCHICCTLPHF